MAKKTAKKPTAAKPKETWADGVARSVSAKLDAEARKARGTVLPGESAAKVCTADEKDRLLDTIFRAAYVLGGRVGTPRLPAGSIVSVGIVVDERREMKVRAHVVEPGGREYEVNA